MVKWCNGEIKNRTVRFFSHKYRICLFFSSEHKIFAAEKAIHNLQFLIINNKYSNQVYVIKPSDHWKTGFRQGSSECCEGDRDYDLNRLDSEISGNPLL